MTKSDLIEEISARTNLPKKRAEDVVNAFFDSMTDALLDDQRIEVRGFGSFSIREYDARTGRNPRTGQKVDVDEKKSVHFKVGKDLRERVADVPTEATD
ncbi:MAG: HU family DNA-binding protein [Myxococcota bacterium]|jgi:integration host factor subunit beta|nr:HU family DNA-binding protein [Myxococcota bacterium]